MDWMKRLFNRLHVLLFRVSRGRVGGTLLGFDILLLSTRGRRSGRVRTTPVVYFRDPSGVFVIAADAGAARHPGWYHNLRTDPRCHVTLVGGKHTTQARIVTGEEREALYGVFRERASELAEQYEQKTSRVFPVVHFALPDAVSAPRPVHVQSMDSG
ncbi:MAG: nitroreductase/quinone reductase family protein [Myxococcales bacterium]|nr:nitroreductase/quinone reductase family protein [Myxococcales bacterium]